MTPTPQRSPVSKTSTEGGGTGASNARVPARGLGAVVMRNEFYRDGYRVLQSIAVTQAIIICVLVFVMVYVVHINQKEIQYFATTSEGKLIPMVPLSEPTLTKPLVQAWASQAATDIMTFGFNDYQKRIAASATYFTPKGFADFTNALASRKVIENIIRNNQLVSAIAGVAVVVREGTVPGPQGLRYEWEVQIPLKITYQSAQNSTSLDRIVTLRIVRASQLEMPQGIGIEQWIEN